MRNTKTIRKSEKIELPPGTEEQIRCRAYQIYEDRGRIDGHELDDSLQAEAEIMTHKVMCKGTAA
jgi:hypothetical protein